MGAYVRRRKLGDERKWCIPSAILRSPGETLNGIAVLDEFRDSGGLLLWLTLDDVTVWASAPARTRPRLLGLCSLHRFAILDADAPRELRYSLDLLSALLASPGDADAEMVGRTCLGIAGWAKRRKAPRTALAFAQVGALAAPMLAPAALETATCALDVQEPERAETWLRRTIAVARRGGDWESYTTAAAMLGSLELTRGGKAADAEKNLVIAYSYARRKAVPLARRDAAFGLLQLAVSRAQSATDEEQRNTYRSAADEYAQAAFRAHRAEQPRSVPVLLAIARYWIERGRAARARFPLGRLRSSAQLTDAADSLAVAAMSAHAFAASADLYLSRTAEARAWELLTDPSIAEEAAFSAALDLAHAAAVRQDRAGLERASQAALRFAPQPRYEWAGRVLAALGYESAARTREARK